MQFSSTTRASDQGTPSARSAAAADVGDNVQALREEISNLAEFREAACDRAARL